MINTVITNHLENLGFIQKWYRNQAAWNNNRMEKKQRRLNKLRNANTEFKTTSEFISSAAIGFYEKHCPKLNWKYDITDKED